MSVFSHKLLILKETFLLDNSLFIVKPSMYLSETTKWSKDRGLKCSQVFIITRFYIHSSLLKTSVQLLHSLEILKSLTVDQGQICLRLISPLLCQLVNGTESYLWPKPWKLWEQSQVKSWEADPLGTYQDGVTVLSWGMDIAIHSRDLSCPLKDWPGWVVWSLLIH